MTRKVIQTWYRAILPDGTVWCESRSAEDVIDSVDDRPGATFARLVIWQETGPWEPWEPDRSF